ncbi:hypothetical protein Cni_G09059 [Canna indica]|uniref:Choline kinase n=1 Tax=Canna indica TaxID=4628 RepID=A0AAQ3Q8H0_9LILI|nr:hypothetical protein Cni_G09059 [Canna indica]
MMVAIGIEDGGVMAGAKVEQPVEKEEIEVVRIPREARKILLSLASGWSDVVDSMALEVTPLKGAMTNEVYQIKWRSEGTEGPRKVLLRIYGEGADLFFDRADEIRTFECMSRHGQGPRLLGRFHNGRVEEFIHARTLAAIDLRDPDISALVASKLREFHGLDMPGPRNVLLWNRMRHWLNVAKGLCPAEEIKEFCLNTLEKDITTLENELSTGDQRIGFCHNDLQYGNIMIDEETGVVTIIVSYSSQSPLLHNLGNDAYGLSLLLLLDDHYNMASLFFFVAIFNCRD